MSKVRIDDERVESLRQTYGLEVSDFWELPQAKGKWCVKHSALEVVAVKAGILFEPPMVLEADSQNGLAVICVTGKTNERLEWSIGEASSKNSRNAYPWAMAEKRAKDRVILKLAGVHGLIYSEDELDTPQKPVAAPPRAETGSVVSGATDHLEAALGPSTGPETMSRYKARPIDGELRKELEACQSVEAINLLWNSPRFQVEFVKFPKSYQDMLTSFRDELIASFDGSAASRDNIEAILRACVTIDALRSVWENNSAAIARMTAEDKAAMEEVKEEMKKVILKVGKANFNNLDKAGS